MEYEDKYGDSLYNLRGLYERLEQLRESEEEWSSKDVMQYLYGFQNDMIHKQEDVIDNMKCGHAVQMDYLEKVAERQERLDIILKNRCPEFDDTWEGLKMTKEWVQELENNVSFFIWYLLHSTPQHTEEAKSLFQEFKTRLEQLKDLKKGRVCLVVYKSLAALEGLLKAEEPKLSERIGQRFKETKTLQEFDIVVDMIRQLEYVLSLNSSLLISDKNKEIPMRCEEVLKVSNQMLEEVKKKMSGTFIKLELECRKSVDHKKRSIQNTETMQSKKLGGGGEGSLENELEIDIANGNEKNNQRKPEDEC